MQKQIAQSVAILFGTIVFDFLFFKAFPGLNVLLITLFFESALFYFYRDSFSQRNVQAVALGTLTLAFCVVFTNSKLAIISFMMSFSFLVGLTQAPELRFIFFGSLLFFRNFFSVPKNLASGISELPFIRSSQRWREYILPIVASFIIGGVFFGIYYIANPRFASLTSGVFDALNRIFGFVFDFGHLLFFTVCLFITGAALWKHSFSGFKSFEDSLANTEALDKSESPTKAVTKMGVIVLITTNLILLFNNMTDLPFVWFNKHGDFSAAEMKSFVHEGTYFLIFGILLAMGVLLWLFRHIQTNTVYSSQWLKNLSIAWLAQNAFLALSVGMRNARYIIAFGLAYKRIGVIFFLILALASMWFLYQKIRKNSSLFEFVTQNSWSLYAVLVLTSCMPWDTFITDYNVKNTPSKDLDIRFLLNEVSDKNAYQLIQYRNKLLESAVQSKADLDEYYTIYEDINSKHTESEFDKSLSKKIKQLQRRQNYIDWRSWNYPDYINGKFIEKNNTFTPVQ